MDENAKTEQDLNDEQLHQITGGCGTCSNDLRAAARYKRIAQGHKNLAKIARDSNMPASVVLAHMRSSVNAAVMGRNLLNGVRARQATPGHDAAPGESSGN